MPSVHTKLGPSEPLDALHSEQQAFTRQRPQLRRRYPGQFVAFYGGQCVGHDRDDEALAARLFREFGDVPFFIAAVNDAMVHYEIPSPELKV